MHTNLRPSKLTTIVNNTNTSNNNNNNNNHTNTSYNNSDGLTRNNIVDQCVCWVELSWVITEHKQTMTLIEGLGRRQRQRERQRQRRQHRRCWLVSLLVGCVGLSWVVFCCVLRRALCPTQLWTSPKPIGSTHNHNKRLAYRGCAFSDCRYQFQSIKWAIK